ncbi:dihydrolipoyllysine-residue succinyltransferase component of 2-oxoglutarate dehydrogenase complex, mitochondrial [Plakobranchus ocellatus]|uniref:Dihydrolipoyllysine-residue succinyltransferase component of 2-oxoglutarate dehydrogenase complex, mitochondrial n=1 Tax=Plakobranchus ocellatus TaxID=259542 RepID=A0AAV3ZX40_9GAST|nr:dihydrolipoyllysine-residue succinyltransferase component of 2-oxoglutarate dehydrogenase complex, mitochondrial [Plakobranchus ocellatus]
MNSGICTSLEGWVSNPGMVQNAVACPHSWPSAGATASNGRSCFHTVLEPSRFSSRAPAAATAHSRSFHTSWFLCADEVISVNAPSFADSVSEGDMRWEKAVGDSVNADELVGEIETDKVSPRMCTSPCDIVFLPRHT